jgi:membrane protease YdiL (CAAX protease family)
MFDLNSNSNKYGAIAFIIGIVNLLAGVFMKNLPYVFLFPMIFLWFLPLFVVTQIEEKSILSLGFRFEEGKTLSYFLHIFLGFIFLTILLGLEYFYRLKTNQNNQYFQDADILIQIIIQLGGVGLPEEVFFRGYLLQRFRDCLGKTRGLFLSSLFFGAGHFLTRIPGFSVDNIIVASFTGIHTFISGLILGYLLMKTKTILVPASSHILLNILGIRILMNIFY